MSTHFPGKRILVVEDYLINQEVTRDMLELLECQVDIAADGVNALKLYSAGNYDLILMDVQIPGKDGLQITREIRTEEQRQSKKARVPIVALTANALSGDRERCLAAGMDDYLSKPLDLKRLEQVLSKFFVK